MKLKKVIFYNVIIFILLFFSLDLFLSYFFLDIKTTTCFNLNAKKNYYDLKKNCTGKEAWKSSFPVVTINTNELGHRVSYSSPKKTPGNKIFFFGDSFTYGVGVEFEKTFFGILENNHPDYQFYNFGVPSYSPINHLYLFKKEIRNKNIPEKIVLLLDLTDVWDAGTRWQLNKNGEPILIPKDHEEENSKRKEINKTFSQKYFQVSRLLISNFNYNIRRIRHKLKIKYLKDYNKVKTSFAANFTYTKIENLNKYYWPEKAFEEGILKIQNTIEEISDISIKNNIEFYLVIYPYAETLVNGQGEFNWEKFSEELCSNDKCFLINTFPKFRKIMKTNKYWLNDNFFIYDEHFNAGGNQVMSDFIDKKMFQK